MSMFSGKKLYKGNYVPFGEAKPFPSEDLAETEKVVVTAGDYGLSMCFMLKSGDTCFFGVDCNSILSVGDEVQLDTIVVQKYKRGADICEKLDGKRVE